MYVKFFICFSFIQTQLLKLLYRYDTANSYVNRFLKTRNCLPRKQGGTNHVVVSDWTEDYIEAMVTAFVAQ